MMRSGPFQLVGNEGCFRYIFLMLLMAGDRLVALGKINHPVIKTIQSTAGEIIDCVDIYKQPAFDHPLLKNHTIEMEPSFIPNVGSDASLNVTAEQAWLKGGSCPEGTVPILRRTRAGTSRYGPNGEGPRNCRVEVSETVSGTQADDEGPYYGIGGVVSLWSLLVRVDEWSLNSIAAVNKQSLVESGWGVSPILFGDSKPRFYINWRDGGKGCYNLDCPGFVQTSRKVALGGSFDALSTYNGDQYVISPAIYKADVQGKWWLKYADEVVGYWPVSLFSDLQSASTVEWLGRVCDTEAGGYHTVTQMGNGHWSTEGWRKASYFRDPSIMLGSSSPVFIAPKRWDIYASYPDCYDVDLYWFTERVPGFFYGGPGGPCCDGRCR